MLLRPGNAGSNTAADHITVIRARAAPAARRQPARAPAGPQVLIRVDGAGGTHELLDWLTAQRLVVLGRVRPARPHSPTCSRRSPRRRGRRRYDADGEIRDGAWVAELTGLLDLAAWPTGMRVIVRRNARTPARSCGSPTPTGTGSPRSPPTPAPAAPPPARRPRTAAPPPRPRRGPHPRREGHRAAQPAAARASTRTGSGAPSSRWPASSPPGPRLLAFAEHPARRWEPKRLRLRLFSIAGRLARHARRARAAPRRRPPLGRAAAHAARPSPRLEPPTRLTHPRPPSRQPRNPAPARGPGARPSDRGRTVIPTSHNHRRHRPPSRATITSTKPTKDPG